MAAILMAALCAAADIDEFKVKREGPFEFAQKPVVTQEGDRVTIAFETKSFCDVTIAIEESRVKVPGTQGFQEPSEQPRIVRHLASGVLGPTAPAPFQRDTKKQAIVWDGKDDLGHYIDEKDKLTVRVSLGLKARFERALFWSPKKRISPGHVPNFVAAPEGVYVHEGGGVDHIRLFTHTGDYARTVYPFPPDRSLPGATEGPEALKNALAKVKGLRWMTFPQDGLVLPVWHGLVQATLFTSGSNTSDHTSGKYGRAASAMARHDGRLALVMLSLNRMATDGTTGGMPLGGPKTTFPGLSRRPGQRREIQVAPRSIAFSPDGKYLYLTGYRGDSSSWLHGVARMEFLGDKPPEVFLGDMNQNGFGSDNAHFCCPGSVAVDAKGRIYVSDYMNDRIQVFTSDGEHLKTIAPVKKPLSIFVDPKTGHIWVGSWMLVNRYYKRGKPEIPATLTHYGPLDEPTKIATYSLPFVKYNPNISWNRTGGVQHGMFIDFHTDPPTVWVVPGTGDTTSKLLQLRADYSPSQYRRSPWMGMHFQLYQPTEGELKKTADFAQDVAKAVVRVKPPQAPALDRQRLYVDPASGDLYVAEGDSGVGKSFRELIKIDPATGRIRIVRLPFTTEDMGFDLQGHIYLRTDRQVSRFRLRDWQEIPWDYGGEWNRPGFDGDGPPLAGAIALPGTGRPGCFHLGGFGVSPGGNVVVSCYNREKLKVRIPGAFGHAFEGGKPYIPTLYPGRVRWAEVHVWDDRGRVLHEDAVPGLPMTDGLALDREGNIYVLAAPTRVLDGKEYPLERAETLMKFKPGTGRILSTNKRAPVPITRESGPKRPFDIARDGVGRAWVEGAEWMYGGVGFGGFNSSKGGGGCACWNARFGLDLYARSFVTELNRFRVAVLDTDGNLIMRIGKYGTVDDGVPLMGFRGQDTGLRDHEAPPQAVGPSRPAGSGDTPYPVPGRPRPVGGDEVALCHPSYVATWSDHRLFIADYGNYRILSVILDYHATERVPMKEVADRS